MDKPELKEIISELYPHMSEASLDIFIAHANYLRYPKGTKIIQEGQSHPFFYLLVTGGVKAYYQKDDKEVCLWFAFEHEMIGTINTLEGSSSNETIELLEDSEFIQFKTEDIAQIIEKDLDISRLIILLSLEYAGFLEKRLYQLQFMTSKERYLSLLEAEPEVLQKVSLTDIASYLGVSRETLSRIRAQV
ncbi:MAG: Crp/Fnr family transcriptional regulator [Bacteroidota bacterium]